MLIHEDVGENSSRSSRDIGLTKESHDIVDSSVDTDLPIENEHNSLNCGLLKCTYKFAIKKNPFVSTQNLTKNLPTGYLELKTPRNVQKIQNILQNNISRIQTVEKKKPILPNTGVEARPHQHTDCLSFPEPYQSYPEPIHQWLDTGDFNDPQLLILNKRHETEVTTLSPEREKLFTLENIQTCNTSNSPQRAPAKKEKKGTESFCAGKRKTKRFFCA